MRQSAWRLNKDPFVSANLVLDKAKEAGGLAPGSYPVAKMVIEPEPGWQVISFAIPGLLEKYGPTVQEFLLDSACTLILLYSSIIKLLMVHCR